MFVGKRGKKPKRSFTYYVKAATGIIKNEIIVTKIRQTQIPHIYTSHSGH